MAENRTIRRKPVRHMVIVAGVLAVGAGVIAIVLWLPWGGSLPRTSRCMLFVSTQAGWQPGPRAPRHLRGPWSPPRYRIEVVANGRVLSSIRYRLPGMSGIQRHRVTFDALGKTNFVFRFVAEGTKGPVFCQPEFNTTTKPGDFLSFYWRGAGRIPGSRKDWYKPMWGTSPDSYLPPLAYKDTFHGLYCWFRPANVQLGSFRLTLWHGKLDVEAFKERARQAGLSVRVVDRYNYVYGRKPGTGIRKEPAPSKFVYVKCPEGRLVDAILEVESWPGVTDVTTSAAVVY